MEMYECNRQSWTVTKCQLAMQVEKNNGAVSVREPNTKTIVIFSYFRINFLCTMLRFQVHHLLRNENAIGRTNTEQMK